MSLLEDIVILLIDILLPNNKGGKVFHWAVRLCIVIGVGALVWKLS